MINSVSREWGNIELPYYDGEVSMLPFRLEDLDSLPLEFRDTIRSMIKNLGNKFGEAYLTVHGKFVKKSNTLRRGAPHIDGNYLRNVASWGGGTVDWKIGENGGTLNSEQHKMSYANDKGGMIIASNYSACKGWNGKFDGVAGIGGDCRHIALGDGFMLKSGKVYYGNSQFIHESLPMDKDVHRVMYRITLPISHESEIV